MDLTAYRNLLQIVTELAFSFVMTLGIEFKSRVFALRSGLIGVFLSAVRAARLNMADALCQA